jgi:hypothetical protein
MPARFDLPMVIHRPLLSNSTPTNQKHAQVVGSSMSSTFEVDSSLQSQIKKRRQSRRKPAIVANAPQRLGPPAQLICSFYEDTVQC